MSPLLSRPLTILMTNRESPGLPVSVILATRGAEAHLGVVAGAGMGRAPARGGGDSRHGVRVRDSRESGPAEISLAEDEASREAEGVDEYQALAADCGATG